jgi:hypothetical protein
MSDPTPLTLGTEAPADAPAARAGGRTGAAVRASGSLDRETYAPATSRGYSEAMGRGIELALTLVVVGGIGWLVDRAAGTYPLFTVIFSLAGFAGISAKLWLGYDLEMRKHDQDAVWNRGSGAVPSDPDAHPRGKVA